MKSTRYGSRSPSPTGQKLSGSMGSDIRQGRSWPSRDPPCHWPRSHPAMTRKRFRVVDHVGGPHRQRQSVRRPGSNRRCGRKKRSCSCHRMPAGLRRRPARTGRLSSRIRQRPGCRRNCPLNLRHIRHECFLLLPSPQASAIARIHDWNEAPPANVFGLEPSGPGLKLRVDRRPHQLASRFILMMGWMVPAATYFILRVRNVGETLTPLALES